MRFLCTADVHIGRISTADGELSGEMSAVGAWERIVEAAIRNEATGLLIAGDLYDSLASQYETRPRVVSAFERLRDKGIRAIAVAGNHDHSALPAFARSHPGLVHVFSASQWEEATVGEIRFVGRSFGRETQLESLLNGFESGRGDALTIGILHADIDAKSPYCPVPLSEMSGRGVAGWLVGHVHAPRLFDVENPVTYPGSPQALDWGETGLHGYRWLTFEGTRPIFSELVPLSSIRYESIIVNLGPGQELEDELQSASAKFRASHPGLESIQYRVDVKVKGRPLPSVSLRPVSLGPDTYWIKSLSSVPALDLAQEASQSDWRGQTARLLLGIEGEGQAEWGSKAQDLLDRLERTASDERRKLALPQEEDLACIHNRPPDEMRNTMERILQRILMQNEERV